MVSIAEWRREREESVNLNENQEKLSNQNRKDKEKTRMKKKTDVHSPTEQNKRYNTCINGIPEEEEKECSIEKT